mgnify:FL=1
MFSLFYLISIYMWRRQTRGRQSTGYNRIGGLDQATSCTATVPSGEVTCPSLATLQGASYFLVLCSPFLHFLQTKKTHFSYTSSNFVILVEICPAPSLLRVQKVRVVIVTPPWPPIGYPPSPHSPVFHTFQRFLVVGTLCFISWTST